jgi:sugar/nucleoside kinase (ribokinase family)
LSPAAGPALDVFGLGQISLDEVRVERADGSPVETTPAVPGGMVATFLVASARLGLRCAFQGAVGDDEAAERALAPLHREGVDCGSVVRVAGGRTRTATVRVAEQGGDRRVEPHRDPRVAVEAVAVDAAAIRRARAVHVDGEDPAASRAALRVAGAAGALTSLDADEPSESVLVLVRDVDFPIVSQGFAEKLSGGSAEAALSDLASMARRTAVITLGERGVIARERERPETVVCPAFAVEVRDTTGAGDAFRAGFVWACLEGFALEDALRAGCAVAALDCRGLGAQGGLPMRRELEAFLQSRLGDRT